MYLYIHMYLYTHTHTLVTVEKLPLLFLKSWYENTCRQNKYDYLMKLLREKPLYR